MANPPPDPAALAALAAHDRIRNTVDIPLFFGNSIGTIFRATSTGLKASKPVSAIQNDSQSEDDEDEEDAEDEVAAFQNKQNNRFQVRNCNQSQGSGQHSN
jgi:hypothetical protein